MRGLLFQSALVPVSHFTLLGLICLIWAGNFIVSAWVVQQIEPLSFTVTRFAVVLLFLAPLLKLPARDQWWPLVMTCWTMGGVHFALLFVALGRSSDVSSIALLMQVYIPISTVLAVIFLGERIGWRTSSGILVAFGGVLVMGLDPLVLAQLDVLVLVLSSAVSLAVGTMLMRRLKGISVLNFQAWNALLSLPLLIALSMVAGQGPLPDADGARQPMVWAAVAYSAIGASIVGHGSFYWLIQRHEVNKVTPYLLMVPVLAVLLGVIFWGDRPGPRLMIGGSMVLAGVLWITLRMRFRRRRPPAHPPTP
ncbi:MAG: DMT family transporter [Wenzhouxiangella sp.]|jgi:O-acetylserine/cysteine efflux transporter|nr:DMT family transporter [Wenzhouxiangella sp.]